MYYGLFFYRCRIAILAGIIGLAGFPKPISVHGLEHAPSSRRMSERQVGQVNLSGNGWVLNDGGEWLRSRQKRSVRSAAPNDGHHGMKMADLNVRPPIVSKPYFEGAWHQNVSVIVGHTAVLRCRVRLLGDRMVSWIRQRDLHVLTSAMVSYTSDGRFSVHHQSSTDDWELRILSTQPRDAGFYECQVNTEPKISWPVYLHVYTAAAQIAGPAEVHVRQGSPLSLSCSLSAPQDPNSTLTWYREGKVILLEDSRSSISLATERSHHFLSSRLLLPRASIEDGGNYTCVPNQALPASVIVHVLSGEHPAAMQHGNQSGKSPSNRQEIIFLIFFSLTSSLYIHR